MNLTSRNSYWFRVFVAGSLLIAALFGARMYESACAAAWRKRNDRGLGGLWARSTVWLMDILEKDHCKKSAMFHEKLTKKC